MVEFFLPIIPPETTHQQKKVHVVNGKPIFYEPDDLKAARSKLMSCLAKHVPEEKMTGPLRMVTKWCFPITGNHNNGEYKYTKPDCGNSNKLLEDCMEELGFFKNDAQIASCIYEKFWATQPGIFIRIEAIE